MKDKGKINCFLGIQFVQSMSKIEMDLSSYLQNILQKWMVCLIVNQETPHVR